MNDSLVYVSWALVGVTFILVIITFSYVLITRKMAKSMEEQADLQKRIFNIQYKPVLMPKIGVVSYSIGGGSKVELFIRVKNAGMCSFYLEAATLYFFHSDFPRIKHRQIFPINEYILPGKAYVNKSIEFDYNQFEEFEGIKGLNDRTTIQWFVEYKDLEEVYHAYPEEPGKGMKLIIL